MFFAFALGNILVLSIILSLVIDGVRVSAKSCTQSSRAAEI